MASSMLEGENSVIFKGKWVTYEVTGEKQKVSLPRRVQAWYYQIDGNTYIEVRDANKALELAKGKAAIAVGELCRLLEVIDIEATNVGELDGLLVSEEAGQQIAGTQRAGRTHVFSSPFTGNPGK